MGALLGTDVLLYVDEFDDPATGWSTGESSEYRVAYEEGALALDVEGEGMRVSTGKSLDASFERLRFAAFLDVQPASEGIYGIHCLGSEGAALGGGVGTGGEYFLYRSGSAGLEMISEEASAPLADTGGGDQVMVMIECAVHSDGSAEMYLSVNGSMLLHHEETGAELTEMNGVGIYLESRGDGHGVRLTEAAVWVAPSAAASPAPTAPELMEAIPTEYLSTCRPIDASDILAGAVAAIACEPDGAFVSYTLFADAAAMNAHLDEAISDRGAGGTENGDCSDGEAAYGEWTLAEQPAGRYLCFISLGYSFLYWSTDALNILAVTNRADEDVAALWDLWREAGPNP